MASGFATIGHSNRRLSDVADMLCDDHVDLLLDVRAFPRSRSNPDFNIDTLPGCLADFDISYRHCPAFGGRRPRQPSIDAAVNSAWRVQSFHNYADYALGEAFAAAFDELVQLGAGHRVALMCAEAVWWRCHRRIITDYLVLNGHAVVHIMGPGKVDSAKPTAGAQRLDNGQVIYPGAAPIPDQETFLL